VTCILGVVRNSTSSSTW